MNKPLSIFFLACAMLFCACSKSTGPTNVTVIPVPVFDSTHFPNHENFEVNGFPSLNGWTFHASIPGDTISFDHDGNFVPPGSPAHWSITLRKSDVPPMPNYVTKSFIHCSSGVYAFTVWLRIKKYLAPNQGYNPIGWTGITRQNGAHADTVSLSSGDSTDWHPVTVIDTLNLLPTDTVTLAIVSGMCDSSCHGNAYWYDDVTFKKLP